MAFFYWQWRLFFCLLLIHVHMRQPLSRPPRTPFLVLLLILIHAIHELPLTQPVVTLELFELQLPLLRGIFELLYVVHQVVHPVMLFRHREPFEILHELPHVLIAVLHGQILILTLKLCSFCSWLFLYLIDYVVVDAIILNQIKNMEFCCTNSWHYSKMDSDFNKVFFLLFNGFQTMRPFKFFNYVL